MLQRTVGSPVYTGAAARRIVALRRAAERMLTELDSSRLEVVLIPASDVRHSGHSVRVVQEANALWYRKFCAEYSSTRKRKNRHFDTMIKRAHTRRALLEIISGRCATPYAQRLARFIEQAAERKRANA
jgi:hypothetical protein